MDVECPAEVSSELAEFTDELEVKADKRNNETRGKVALFKSLSPSALAKLAALSYLVLSAPLTSVLHFSSYSFISLSEGDNSSSFSLLAVIIRFATQNRARYLRREQAESGGEPFGRSGPLIANFGQCHCYKGINLGMNSNMDFLIGKENYPKIKIYTMISAVFKRFLWSKVPTRILNYIKSLDSEYCTESSNNSGVFKNECAFVLLRWCLKTVGIPHVLLPPPSGLSRSLHQSHLNWL